MFLGLPRRYWYQTNAHKFAVSWGTKAPSISRFTVGFLVETGIEKNQAVWGQWQEGEGSFKMLASVKQVSSKGFCRNSMWNHIFCTWTDYHGGDDDRHSAMTEMQVDTRLAHRVSLCGHRTKWELCKSAVEIQRREKAIFQCSVSGYIAWMKHMHLIMVWVCHCAQCASKVINHLESSWQAQSRKWYWDEDSMIHSTRDWLSVGNGKQGIIVFWLRLWQVAETCWAVCHNWHPSSGQSHIKWSCVDSQGIDNLTCSHYVSNCT